MISLDPIICNMEDSECEDCYCSKAISDIDDQDVAKGQEVDIHGSFCYPVAGHTHMSIIARDSKTKQDVWTKVCDTGQMCTIPFTSEEGFVCINV